MAVTRETVVRFSRPLAPDTLLNFNQFKAVAAGRRIISRIELSSDRRTATLYYLENLPGSSRVKVTFDGTTVKDSLGQLVDADGDGLAGGVGVVEFDTVSVQPVTGTAIIGRVFASEPVPILPGAAPLMNRPLEGVTVTVDGVEEALRTETDADGNFILSPCPAGRFFDHVDGANVSAAERAALLALRLPSNPTNADATKLLDRLDGMVRGTLTPAAAGLEAMASAAQAFEGVALQLKSRGWTTTVDAFKNSLDGPASPPVARGVARAAAARASQASEAPLFFRLVDLRTGFQRRGQLGEQGVFTGIILAPGTLYRVEYLNPRTLHTAVQQFVSATAGLRTKLPLAVFLRDPQPDRDGDGLADLAEAILSTDPAKVDTDGDGLRDGGEVTGGTNPLDGLVAAAGIVATADTPGSALDVCVQGNRAVVADRTAGVAVFNVFSGLNPTLIAQVDTPGTAQAVACDRDLVAVADGTSGLAVIDLGDPANAMRLHQVALGGTASAVAARNGVAYVALGGSAVASDGVVAVVDLLVGTELTRLTGLSDADDVALADGYLYVLTGVDLRVYHDYLGGLDLIGQINVAGSPAPLESGRKLFVGGGLGLRLPQKKRRDI